MNTFKINYIEEFLDPAENAPIYRLLGKASYDRVEEPLLPDRGKYDHLYFTAKFTGNAIRRWRVDSLDRTPSTATAPASCNIVLKAYNGPVETYLETTLSNGGKISALMRPGTLVEVDYGFIPALVRHNGASSLDNSNTDALLKGEMHKRRLAIVARASSKVVQVIPVTSKEPGAGDKTCFEISADSLKNLVRYSTSGSQSWALCSMVDSVSTSRVLPAETFNSKGGSGRSTLYPEGLSRDERIPMISCLAHFIGLSNYEELRTVAEELKDLKAKQKRNEKKVAAMEKEAAYRQAMHDVASDMAKDCKRDLEAMIQERIEFNAELAALEVTNATEGVAG